MEDLEKLSDEELMKIASGGAAEPADDLESLSDEELLKIAGQDPTMPSYLNGAEPVRAINKAPPELRAGQRLELKGFGSTLRGQSEYLSKMFDGVVMDPETNAFKVKSKKDGLWYEVDPNTSEGVDAWTKTKGVAAGLFSTAVKAFDAMTGGLGREAARSVAADKGVKESVLAAPAALANQAEQMATAMTSGQTQDVARETVGEIAENFDTIALTAASFVPGGQAATLGSLGLRGALAAGAKQAVPAAFATGLTKMGLTSMGRLVGTYDASPEEQLSDAAFESLLVLGGNVIGAGTSFGVKELAKSRAAVQIGNVLRDAPASKLNFIKSIGRMAGIDDVSFDRLATPNNKVQSFIEQAQGSTNIDQAIDSLRLSSVDDVQKLGANLRKELNNVYDLGLADLSKYVPRNKTINVSFMADQIFDSLKNTGFVTFDEATKAYKLLPFEQVRSAGVAEGISRVGSEATADRASYKLAREVVEELNRWKGATAEIGPDALRAVRLAQKKIDNITRMYQVQAKQQGNNALQGFSQQIHKSVEGALGKTFEAANIPELATRYNKFVSDYAVLKSNLNPLFDAATDVTRAGTLVNAMSSRAQGSAINRRMMEEAARNIQTMTNGHPTARVMAERILDSVDRIADRNAAIQFVRPLNFSAGPLRYASYAGILAGSGSAALSGDLQASGAATAGAFGLAAAGSNPRVALSLARNYLKLNGIMARNAGRPLVQTFLKTDALERSFGALMSSGDTEASTRDSLLQQIGAPPSSDTQFRQQLGVGQQ